MRAYLLTGLALLAGGSIASAQETAPRDWSGVWVGGAVGAMHADYATPSNLCMSASSGDASATCEIDGDGFAVETIVNPGPGQTLAAASPGAAHSDMGDGDPLGGVGVDTTSYGYAFVELENSWAESFAMAGPLGGDKTPDFSGTGGMVSAHLRRDWQTERGLVYGMEADFGMPWDSSRDWSNTTAFIAKTAIGPVAFPDGVAHTVSFKQGPTATLRARLGYAAGDFLPYLTAGIGISSFEARSTVSILGGALRKLPRSQTDSATMVAPVVGAGISWMATDRIALSSETLYFAFDDELHLGGYDPIGIDDTWSTTLKVSFKLN